MNAYQNELEQSGLVDLAEVKIPRQNVVGSLLILLVLSDGSGMLEVVLAVVDDLQEDLSSDIGKCDCGLSDSLHVLCREKMKFDNPKRIQNPTYSLKTSESFPIFERVRFDASWE